MLINARSKNEMTNETCNWDLRNMMDYFNFLTVDNV
jgi:hypothetical protein